MSGESWYGSDSKVWFYVSMIVSVTIVAVGVIYMMTAPETRQTETCEAPSTSPNQPVYVECKK